MSEILITVLLLVGASFLLLASVGIIRMPDLYSRLQAAAKASTLGAGCVVIALALHFSNFEISIRALLVVGFLFLTAPVAAHVIARAAYFIGVPMWENTLIDELHGHYDLETHRLECPDDVIQAGGGDGNS